MFFEILTSCFLRSEVLWFKSVDKSAGVLGAAILLGAVARAFEAGSGYAACLVHMVMRAKVNSHACCVFPRAG